MEKDTNLNPTVPDSRSKPAVLEGAREHPTGLDPEFESSISADLEENPRGVPYHDNTTKNGSTTLFHSTPSAVGHGFGTIPYYTANPNGTNSPSTFPNGAFHYPHSYDVAAYSAGRIVTPTTGRFSSEVFKSSPTTKFCAASTEPVSSKKRAAQSDKGRNAKEPKKSTGANSKSASSRAKYSEEETMYLLDLMEEYLPLNQYSWEEVEQKFNADARFQFHYRCAKGLKRKFTSLSKMKMPTGDPKCPETVKRAKQVDRMLIKKSEMSTGEEDEDYLHVDSDLEEPVPENSVEQNSSTTTSSSSRRDVDKYRTRVTTVRSSNSHPNARITRNRNKDKEQPTTLQQAMAAILNNQNNASSDSSSMLTIMMMQQQQQQQQQQNMMMMMMMSNMHPNFSSTNFAKMMNNVSTGFQARDKSEDVNDCVSVSKKKPNNQDVMEPDAERKENEDSDNE